MKMTQREFFIAVGAALFGFFLCYFLFGTSHAPRSPAVKMTLIAPLPSPGPTNQPLLQFRSPVPQTNPPILRMSSFGFRNRPELLGYKTPSLKLDLMSSRHRAEVDLSDLQ